MRPPPYWFLAETQHSFLSSGVVTYNDMGRDELPPKPDPDDGVFEVCPVARAFEIVGSKWRLTVLRSLHLYGEQRFSELQETTTADSTTLQGSVLMTTG